MANAEIMRQLVGDAADEGITRMPARHHQMCGERGFGGAHWPDVEIVDRRHAALVGQIAAHSGVIDPVWHTEQPQLHCALEQPPGAPADHRQHQQTGRRINPLLAGLPDQKTSHHHRR